MKITTKTNTLLKHLIYKNHFTKTPAMQYGLDNEGTDIYKFTEERAKTVSKCGLFLHSDYKFIVTSTDGIINEK